MRSKELQKNEKSKTMWIPKKLLEVQQSKEASKLASKIAIYLSKPLKYIPPSPPSSILGPYLPKSLSFPPSKSQYPKSIFPPLVHQPLNVCANVDLSNISIHPSIILPIPYPLSNAYFPSFHPSYPIFCINLA